jgi:hypothetical protein
MVGTAGDKEFNYGVLPESMDTLPNCTNDTPIIHSFTFLTILLGTYLVLYVSKDSSGFSWSSVHSVSKKSNKNPPRQVAWFQWGHVVKLA